MNVFFLLMWKNLIVRSRRCFWLSIELIPPLFFIMTLAIIDISPRCRLRDMWRPRASDTAMEIVYTPANKPAKMLMDEVTDALNIPRFQSVPEDYEKRLLRSSGDEGSKMFKALTKADAIIVFENFNSNETLPDTLNYTMRIRERNDNFSETLKSTKIWRSLYGPADELDDSLLKLQWAINSRFIKMKSESSFELQKLVLRPKKYKHMDRTGECHWIKYFIIHAILFFSPLVSFVIIMSNLNEERCNGIEALIEVSGVPWFMIDVTNFLDRLQPCLIISVAEAIFFPLNSNKLIIFMCVFFHYLSIIAFAFACSNLTICGSNVMSTALFVYVGFFLFDLAIWPAGSDRLSLRLKGLLPHVPSFWFMQQLYATEFTIMNEGISFNEWWLVFIVDPRRKRKYKYASLKLTVEMLLIQIAIYFMLALFLRLIRPKKYGKTLAWNFLFKKNFWVKRVNYIPPSTSNHHPAYDRYFEDPPNDLDVAVEVINVKKTYSSKFTSFVALSDVSLKIYRGEITVIVGHNGSGKTTLLSIIAGMQQQSSGKVFVERLDTTVSKMKKKIAFCPQRNILFPLLTIEEHLMVFSTIAGDPKEGAAKTTERVMTLMDLNVMKFLTPSELSIGLKRRLQIGCMLCSQASLLLLDDPTAEIDIETRKDLYQILSTLRGERTIILSTNFLEEANMLGDRVAALQQGILRCYATPQFLKKAIDTGSRVNITSFQPTDSDIVTKMIRGAAPDITLSENVMGTLVYNVPLGSNMTTLLDTLEANRDAMDIESLGVGPVSLEEAFMKLCTDGEMDTSKELENILKNPDQITRTEGMALVLVQIRELFQRQLDYTYSRLLAFIFLHFIAPICLTTLLFIFFKQIQGPFELEGFTDVEMNMYSQMDEPLATYIVKENNLNNTQRTIKKMKELFPQMVLRAKKEEPEKFCNCTKCDKYHKSRNIFDIYVDTQTARLNYDRDEKYAAMVGLNVLSNVIAAQQLPYQNHKAISMRIGSGKYERGSKFWEYIISDLFSAFIILIVLIPVIDDMGLPCKERTSKTRYYHIVAGCSPWLYWLVTFIYHIAYNAIIFLPGIVVASAILDYETVLRRPSSMRALYLCLLFIGISFYTIAYFISQYFNEEATKIILLEIIIFGLFAYIYYDAAEYITWADLLFFHQFFSATDIFNPVLMYSQIIKHMVFIAIYNDACYETLEKKLCPNLPSHFDDSRLRRLCCNKNLGRDYGTWVNYFSDTITPNLYLPGLHRMMSPTTAYIVVPSILVLLIEHKLFRKLWNKYEQQRPVKMPSRKYESNDIAAEKEYIKNTVMRSKETIKESVLVSRVWKCFFKLFDEPEFVLKDLNYSVRKGECFGFVGLNGSGKTSVFKAMTRQFLVTKGLMYADGYFSHEDTGMYLKELGYCPHSLYLDTFRTGSNNMRMLMCLRGIDNDEVKTQCEAWQKILGLDRFRQVLVEEYSYGMERRLSLGTAMCRGDRVLLLDQPMSGVDVAARRQLWAVIERALANGCSIVHASHNMKLVDRLCNQLTILDGGEMAALGSPSDYKKSYASGNSVVIKLRASSVFTSSGAARVQALKDFMYQEFNCFLRDDHLLCLHFIVTERLRYTVIHEKLSSMANEFREIVEEYSAYDANFEDAFFQFLNDSRYSIKPKETW